VPIQVTLAILTPVVITFDNVVLVLSKEKVNELKVDFSIVNLEF
jgi:hypothetical protein